MALRLVVCYDFELLDSTKSKSIQLRFSEFLFCTFCIHSLRKKQHDTIHNVQMLARVVFTCFVRNNMVQYSSQVWLVSVKGNSNFWWFPEENDKGRMGSLNI